MRSLARAIVFAVALGLGILPGFVPTATRAATVALNTPQLFDSESAAQRHCPRDVVVWLNIPTGIYHEKGMRWCGRTKHAPMYVTEKLTRPAIATRGTVSEALAHYRMRKFLLWSLLPSA